MRIVLLCDNRERELAALELVKQALERNSDIKVWIIGSIAEQQRIYFHLWRIKPNCVFISQTVEACVRNIASYVKTSGAKLYILPAEITISPALTWIFLSKSLSYNNLVDGIFLPGKSMLEIYRNCDIPSKKLHITGTPKIDIVLRANSNDFLDRKTFMRKYGANPNQKNLFVFSSFVPITEDYAANDPAFQGNVTEIRRYNNLISRSELKFGEAFNGLARDFPKTNIFVKCHPLEKHTPHLSKSPNLFLVREDNFYNCVKSIDLAIHWNSTVAVECWVRKIPTIQFIPLKSSLASIAESRFGNPVAFRYPELKLLVQRYLTQKLSEFWLRKQQTYLKKNFFRLDGLTAQRIAKIIKALNKTHSDTHYSRHFPISYFVFEIFYQVLGKSASRRLISFARPFVWKYAINNDVFVTPRHLESNRTDTRG